MAGNLAATIDQTGTLSWLITNMDGDTIATAADTDLEPATYYLTDEYGLTISGYSTPARYGWLGGKQRGHDDLAGLTLMGVRLYTPTLGRFLQTDPIPGGNANAYSYPADPINAYDLDGQYCIVWGYLQCYALSNSYSYSSYSYSRSWRWRLRRNFFSAVNSCDGGCQRAITRSYAKKKNRGRPKKGAGTGETKHGKDRGAQKGISPDMKEQAIRSGRAVRGRTAGTTKYIGQKIWVVVNHRTGRIISAGWNRNRR